MNIDRLNEIEATYHAVLETPAGERDAMIDKLCVADADLRREVETLLAFEKAPENFLDAQPEALAAEMFSQKESEADLSGKQISHYHITRLLGSGGMGEVYLAEDTKLRRNVALKILPTQFSTDKERKRRFENEARAVSALNHPNIITIYEIGESESTSFMATEFIDGHTLRHLIAEGPISWQETVRIAIQVAGALQSAHSVGIVHRDIKPANIMVRHDGIVKVLDFGLAKLTAPDTGEFESRENTAPQRVMGTINYMSPEQALGERIDYRTDIFSFGVVIYEMLTGEVPFAGPSAAAVYNATIHRSLLSVCERNVEIPAALDRIVKHALEKDRDVRCQSFADLRADLKLLLRDPQTDSFDYPARDKTVRQTDPNPDTPSTGSNEAGSFRSWVTGERVVTGSRPRWAMLILAALLVVTGGGAFWFYTQASRPKAALSTATVRIVPFTAFSGIADQPAFSPDGDQIAFTWDGGGKNLDIYVKLIGAGGPLRITTDAAQDISPAWSPDGRYLAFIRRTAAENGIYIVPALGGGERKLGKAEPTLSSQAFPECGLNWSPDGKFLAVADKGSPDERFGISLLSADDGEKRRLTSPPESSADNAPVFSPDGTMLAFIRNTELTAGDIYVTDTGGGEPRRITSDGRRIHSLAWTADGREIFFSSNRGGGFSLWSVSVSGGEPERVAGAGQNAYSPAISRQGDRMAFNVSFIDSDIWSLDLPGPAVRRTLPAKVISSTQQDHSPQYSPDGKKVIFASDRSGSDEIWVADADGSAPTQLTFFNGNAVGSPRWSPDSRQVVFDARPRGNADIYVINADGGKPRPLVADPSHDVMASWSRNGNWLYFCSNRSGTFQIWKVPAGGGDAVQVTQQGGIEAFESPGGDIVYYTKTRGTGGIWQVPATGGEEREVPELLGSAYWRYWAVVDNGIYFVSATPSGRPAVMFFSFATRGVTRIGVIERDLLIGLPGLTVSPDKRSILYTQADQSKSDIMLVENFR